MKKPYRKALLIALFISLILTLLTSCSPHKTQRSKIVEETKIEVVDTSSTKTTDNSVISIIQVDSTNEIVIEPIDTAKAMVVDGKQYKNARIKHKKVVRNKVVDIKKNVAKIERKAVKVVASGKRIEDVKVIDRKTPYWWWLFWFFLLVLIWIAYKYLTR